MSLQRIVHHVTEKTIELTLQTTEAPPRPPWVREDLWYGGGGDVISVTVPVGKRLSVGPPTGIALIGQDADGKDIYMRYTWDGDSWESGVRVNPATGLPL